MTAKMICSSAVISENW